MTTNFLTLYDTPNGQPLPDLNQVMAELSQLSAVELWGIAYTLKVSRFPPQKEGVLEAIRSELEIFYFNFNQANGRQK